MNPYRKNAKPKYKSDLMPTWLLLVTFFTLFSGGGFLVGYLIAPEKVEVEVEVQPNFHWREVGCTKVCGDAGVASFARNNSYGYVCQCVGTEPVPVEAFEELF